MLAIVGISLDQNKWRNMKKLFWKFIAASAVLAISASAFAIPVTFTLGNVRFTDGTLATGTFTYDADTNTYSAVNITTLPSAPNNGATFTFTCVAPCTGFTPNSTGVLFLTAASNSNLTGTTALNLNFAPQLSNLGGGSNVSGQQDTCADPQCLGVTAPLRFIASGSVTAPGLPARPVPTLSPMALGMLALFVALAAGLGYRRVART